MLRRNEVLRWRPGHEVSLLPLTLLFAAEKVPPQTVVHRELLCDPPAILGVGTMVGLERVNGTERRHANRLQSAEVVDTAGHRRRNLTKHRTHARRRVVVHTHHRGIAAVPVVLATCVWR